MNQIKSFECHVVGHEEFKSIINAPSFGKAKSIFCAKLKDWEFFIDTLSGQEYASYTSLRCKCIGDPISGNKFIQCANKRGVPFAKIGMQVTVNGEKGMILGSNCSANFDVIFEDGNIANCHPNWEMRFFGNDGSEVME